MKALRHPSRNVTLPDLLIVAGILAAALVSFLLTLSGGDGAVCIVSHPGGEERCSLAVPRTVSVHSNGYTLSVTIANGAVSVTESDCPDGICVNSGTVSRAGQAIVCVPAEVIVRVIGTSGADAVAGGVG